MLLSQRGRILKIKWTDKITNEEILHYLLSSGNPPSISIHSFASGIGRLRVLCVSRLDGGSFCDVVPRDAVGCHVPPVNIAAAAVSC